MFSLFLANIASSQLHKPITWSFAAKKINKTAVVLQLSAKLESKWHIYAQSVQTEAMRLKFIFNPSTDFMLIGKTIEPKPIRKYDKVVKLNLAYFENEVIFTQKIKLNRSKTIVKGKIEFMLCNDKSCLPATEVDFSIPIK